jgi:two-component system NtrC family response regulator
VRLLRVLESRKLTRVGGTEEIDVDVRIVSATNADIEDQIKDGTFREDLFFRLNVFPIRIPPLRDRRSDIPLLVNHFRTLFMDRTGVNAPEFSSEAMNSLVATDWPGNIRQLRNAVERVLILSEGVDVTPADLALAGFSGPTTSAEVRAIQSASPEDLHLGRAVEAIERQFIQQALNKANGVKAEAARILGITRPTLDKKIRDHGITY